ncbi:hypothetical protein SPI02_13230 [Staphylococcus piscifermentans]|uniref:Uncharacterized protein n=1 Tax=Staphylococcus piscifermentans TaxID=70258 RepID=A0A512QMS3_9STAP|nr:hypothetical protein SPI02_13230 [Staphylococcus piscifermentans]
MESINFVKLFNELSEFIAEGARYCSNLSGKRIILGRVPEGNYRVAILFAILFLIFNHILGG